MDLSLGCHMRSILSWLSRIQVSNNLKSSIKLQKNPFSENHFETTKAWKVLKWFAKKWLFFAEDQVRCFGPFVIFVSGFRCDETISVPPMPAPAPTLTPTPTPTPTLTPTPTPTPKQWHWIRTRRSVFSSGLALDHDPREGPLRQKLGHCDAI